MENNFKSPMDVATTVTTYFRAIRVLNVLGLVADELFGLKNDDDIEKYVSDISTDELVAFQELLKRFNDLPPVYMKLFKMKKED